MTSCILYTLCYLVWFYFLFVLKLEYQVVGTIGGSGLRCYVPWYSVTSSKRYYFPFVDCLCVLLADF